MFDVRSGDIGEDQREWEFEPIEVPAIYAPGAIDGGGNRAAGNKGRPQCVGVKCAP